MKYTYWLTSDNIPESRFEGLFKLCWTPWPGTITTLSQTEFPPQFREGLFSVEGKYIGTLAWTKVTELSSSFLSLPLISEGKRVSSWYLQKIYCTLSSGCISCILILRKNTTQILRLQIIRQEKFSLLNSCKCQKWWGQASHSP